MQSNIFELIDLLVKMSGSNSNLDELKADLDDTESRILKMQSKLKNLEEEMSDDKYFDASSEIVDRNIKISLVKKLQKLNKVKNDISKELENVKSDEVSLHRKLDEIRTEISKANQYNEILNDNVSTSDSYNSMIASENDRISKLISRKDDLEEKYTSVQKKVEYLADSLNEVDEKINKEKERLDDVDNNLSNIKAYIDIEAKEKDENKYVDIKDELDTLNKHKDDILNDGSYIAGKIKELLADENKEEVEDEFNRLVSIVKSIPYMDLEATDIEKEKAALDNELKKYDEEISQKQYQTMDKEFIDERIKYLKESIEKIANEIAENQNKAAEIENDNEELSQKIFNAESQISKINSSLIDYESYDYENNDLQKSVVQASNNKLIEERENISSIADNYRNDLVNKLSILKSINERLICLNKEKETKENELNELEKKSVLCTKSRNILEEEKDKIKLEKINKSILDLKNRENYSKSLSEICDEFQMLISSLEFVDGKLRAKILYEESEEPLIKDEEPSLVKEEELAPVKDETEQVTNVEIKEVDSPNNEPKSEETIAIQEENNDFIFPSLDTGFDTDVKKNDEKLRVVEITDVPNNLTESTDNEYMVNDFQDDEYIDLDTAMTSVEGN